MTEHGRSPSGRATRPTDQAPAGLGDTASVPNAHELRLQKLRETEILAVSSSACFYPERDNPDEFDGTTITWTFELPKSSRDVGSGVYRLQFLRTLAEEEALGNPVLAPASAIEARSDATGTGAAEGESAVGEAETPEQADAHD